MPTAQELIRELLAAGLTQLHIAEKAGVSQSTVSRLLAGGTENARSNTWFQLFTLREKLYRN